MVVSKGSRRTTGTVALPYYHVNKNLTKFPLMKLWEHEVILLATSDQVSMLYVGRQIEDRRTEDRMQIEGRRSMILKLKYSSSMLSPIVIDQIAEVAPNPGVYYMIPGTHRKWEIHTKIGDRDDGTNAGLILEEDCRFYDGDVEPEAIEGVPDRTITVPIRVLDLTLRNGTVLHIYYATEFFDVFLMSDEGKTIDRLPK